jgi:hypothetical protein
MSLRKLSGLGSTWHGVELSAKHFWGVENCKKRINSTIIDRGVRQLKQAFKPRRFSCRLLGTTSFCCSGSAGRLARFQPRGDINFLIRRGAARQEVGSRKYYYGTDIRQFLVHSPASGVKKSRVPLVVVILDSSCTS